MNRRVTVPKWVLLVPMVGSLVLIFPQFLNLCRPGHETCFQLIDRLSWVVAVFPHAMILPLLMVLGSAWKAMAILIGLDLLLGLLVWRTQPAQLSTVRFAAILAIWVGLSMVTTFAMPDVATRAYHLTH